MGDSPLIAQDLDGFAEPGDGQLLVVGPVCSEAIASTVQKKGHARDGRRRLHTRFVLSIRRGIVEEYQGSSGRSGSAGPTKRSRSAASSVALGISLNRRIGTASSWSASSSTLSRSEMARTNRGGP